MPLSGPCPLSDIEKQVEKINKIFEREQNAPEEGIKNVVEDPRPQEENRKEEIGILPLLNTVIPEILTDLEKEVRYHMSKCDPKIGKEVLVSCHQAVDKYIAPPPRGTIIKTCCLNEKPYQECLEKCYLEEGKEKYKSCLEACLKQKSLEAKQAGKAQAEEIAWCLHALNFYCCSK